MVEPKKQQEQKSRHSHPYHSESKSKRGVFIIVAILIILVAITIFISCRRTAIVADVPSVYNFGLVAPFTVDGAGGADSAGRSLNINISNATAQYVTLGEKPLLHIEHMDVSNCSGASVFIAKSLNSQDKVAVGKVLYETGNTNYEIPPQVNVSQYPIVVVWCDSTNARIGYAFMQ